METTHKKRSPNFTTSELELLQKICLKNYNIIENKKSNAVSWQSKQAQWDKIALEFNAQNITNRYLFMYLYTICISDTY